MSWKCTVFPCLTENKPQSSSHNNHIFQVHLFEWVSIHWRLLSFSMAQPPHHHPPTLPSSLSILVILSLDNTRSMSILEVGTCFVRLLLRHAQFSLIHFPHQLLDSNITFPLATEAMGDYSVTNYMQWKFMHVNRVLRVW